MASPIAHLPMHVNLTTHLNGSEITLATVEIPVPIKVSNPRGGYVDVAVDTDELRAMVRRAATALDSQTTTEG